MNDGAAAPCFCDRMGVGEPGVSCGDCPTRDYPHLIAKTNAERQREHRARLVAEARENRAAGLVLLKLWAHPEDAPAIRAAAAKAAKQRTKGK